MSEKLIKDCTDEYHKSVDRLSKLIIVVMELLEKELKEQGILARVSGRIKTRDSLKAKLENWVGNRDKLSILKTKRGVFAAVGDLAAVRVMTYIESDRKKVADIAQKLFDHRPNKPNFELEEKELAPRIKKNSSNFYRATHMQICLRDKDLTGGNDNLHEDHCELQITSMLAHVWNEIEHDIGYKGGSAKLSEDEKLALVSLGHLTQSGDSIIANLINANIRRKNQSEFDRQAFTTPAQLTEYLSNRFGKKINNVKIDYKNRADLLLRALQHIKLNHPNDFAQKITVNGLDNARRERIRFKNHLSKSKSAKVSFFDNSCDIFLLALFKEYGASLADSELHGGRQEVALARQYQAFRNK